MEQLLAKKIFSFGKKHVNKSYEDIIKEDKSYIKFMITKNILDINKNPE